MRDYPLNGRISSSQRERARRGRKSAGCQISGRWLRFGDPFTPGFLDGDAVMVDVLTDVYDDQEVGEPRTKKLTSLMIDVEDLRAILEQLDEERERAEPGQT